MPNISLINNDGQAVGAKKQAALTPDDIYHGVFVLLITPSRELIASQLPTKKLSVTAATVCRESETPEAAATRALTRTTRHTPVLHHLGDQFYTPPDGRKVYMSVFYGVATLHEDATGCTPLTSSAFAAQPQRCTAALRFILDTYRHALPM